MRAIVVNDSPGMRQLLARLLREAGFSVLEAEDGPAALSELACGAPVDLALLDWRIPGIDGAHMLRALRSDRANDAMRIVLVGGDLDARGIERAFASGASDFLMKPFTRDALYSKLTRLGLGPEPVEAAAE